MDDDDFVPKTSQDRSSVPSIALRAPKRPAKKNDLVIDDKAELFSEPLFSTKTVTASDDSFGLSLVSPPKENMPCQFCKKNLAHLTDARKTLHMNKCLDQHETKIKFDRAKKKHANTIDCPLCGEPQPPGPYRAAHVKRCSKEHNVGARQSLQAMEFQQKAADIKKKKGIAHTKAPVPEKKIVTAPKLRGEPKSFLDEQIQLAKALSASTNTTQLRSEVKRDSESPQFTRVPDPNANRRKRPRSYAIVELAPRSCKCEVLTSLHDRFLDVFRIRGKTGLKNHCEQQANSASSYAIQQGKMLDKLSRLERLSDDLSKLLDSAMPSSADFHITCNDGVVAAHRHILSSRTRGFLSKDDSIRVSEHSSQTMRFWLKYVYCGRVEWALEDNDVILELATKYGPECLPSVCNRFSCRPEYVEDDVITEMKENQPESIDNRKEDLTESIDNRKEDEIKMEDQPEHQDDGHISIVTEKFNDSIFRSDEHQPSENVTQNTAENNVTQNTAENGNKSTASEISAEVVKPSEEKSNEVEPIEIGSEASMDAVDCEDPLEGLNMSASTIVEESDDDENRADDDDDVIILDDDDTGPPTKNSNNDETEREKEVRAVESAVGTTPQSAVCKSMGPPAYLAVKRGLRYSNGSADVFEDDENDPTLPHDKTPEDLNPSWQMTPLKLDATTGDTTYGDENDDVIRRNILEMSDVTDISTASRNSDVTGPPKKNSSDDVTGPPKKATYLSDDSDVSIVERDYDVIPPTSGNTGRATSVEQDDDDIVVLSSRGNSPVISEIVKRAATEESTSASFVADSPAAAPVEPVAADDLYGDEFWGDDEGAAAPMSLDESNPPLDFDSADYDVIDRGNAPPTSSGRSPAHRDRYSSQGTTGTADVARSSDVIASFDDVTSRSDDVIPRRSEVLAGSAGFLTGDGESSGRDAATFDSFDRTPPATRKRRSSRISYVDSFDQPVEIASAASCSSASSSAIGQSSSVAPPTSGLSDCPIAHSTPAQPANKKLKFGSNVKILKTSAITPMPDYEGMDDTQLKQQLALHGLRPAGRKKAITLLRRIYDAVHPVIDPSTPTIRPLPKSRLEQVQQEENGPGKKKGPARKKNTVAAKKAVSDEMGGTEDQPGPSREKTPTKKKTLAQKLTSPSSEADRDDAANRTLNDTGGDEPLEESMLDDGGVLPKDIDSMTAAFLKWLRRDENEQLHYHMLSLQPVMIDELHVRLSRANCAACTIPKNALGTILNRLGATFSLPQPAKGRRGMGGGGGRGRRK